MDRGRGRERGVGRESRHASCKVHRVEALFDSHVASWKEVYLERKRGEEREMMSCVMNIESEYVCLTHIYISGSELELVRLFVSALHVLTLTITCNQPLSPRIHFLFKHNVNV